MRMGLPMPCMMPGRKADALGLGETFVPACGSRAASRFQGSLRAAVLEKPRVQALQALPGNLHRHCNTVCCCLWPSYRHPQTASLSFEAFDLLSQTLHRSESGFGCGVVWPRARPPPPPPRSIVPCPPCRAKNDSHNSTAPMAN